MGKKSSEFKAFLADAFGHGHDGKYRRIPQREREQRGIGDKEVSGKTVMMKRGGFMRSKRKHAPGMPGIQGAEKYFVISFTQAMKYLLTDFHPFLKSLNVQIRKRFINPPSVNMAGTGIRQFNHQTIDTARRIAPSPIKEKTKKIKIRGNDIVFFLDDERHGNLRVLPATIYVSGHTEHGINK